MNIFMLMSRCKSSTKSEAYSSKFMRHYLKFILFLLIATSCKKKHGVMFKKLWGVLRGRSDILVYEDDGMYFKAFEVSWALHNHRAMDGPLFDCIL